jgi:dihydroorotate dehydrogenase (fumarate)
MRDLSVKYLGLQLKSPLVVSSSGLTDSVSKIKRLAEYGAGAVVLKSLFEEQIQIESGLYDKSISTLTNNAEYLHSYIRNNSAQQYLDLINDSRNKTDIPIIASINCVSAGEWLNFAQKIEQAGANALELNAFFLPLDKDFKSNEYERIYLDLATKVRSVVNIPISIKLGTQFTNLLNLVDELAYRNINGVSLFNRFYQPDIDINKLSISAGEVFSTARDFGQTLRWVSLISGKVEHIDVAASGGIHDGDTVIKMLLAGAKAVEVCSSLYKYGPSHLRKLSAFIPTWMEEHNFNSISEFNGMLNYKNVSEPVLFERSQFIKYFSSLS